MILVKPNCKIAAFADIYYIFETLLKNGKQMTDALLVKKKWSKFPWIGQVETAHCHAATAQCRNGV